MSENQRLPRAERLLEVVRNLSAALEGEVYLQSLIATAGELTASEAASLLELDEAAGHFRFVASPWFHRDALRSLRVPREGSLAGLALSQGRPLIVQDVPRHPLHFRAADEAAGFLTRSLLAVPVLYRGQALGVLEAVNKAGGAHYTEDDILVLETLASQAALCLQTMRLQRRVQATYDEMAQLDRMKTDFIAIASHELRTPLGLILGHATFLREIIGQQHRDHLDTIVRNAERLKEIIDNLASMDNVQAGVARLRRRRVSVARIIEEVVDSFQADAARKRIHLTFDTGGQELAVDGDAGKISVALSNLVKNAITFTDPEGHVFVVGEAIPGYVKVSVIDDGIGIPAADLPRVFERFYQVESHLTRRHGGMGLGLSVARVMVELHGGRIWAESVEGRGSNFTFLLPLDPSQADAASRMFSP